MSPTVADVVALPVVQAGAPEIISASGLDSPVRWVHVSDVADLSNLLQGGELVFTRGGALRRSPRRYLERLARARAVGVVVELGEDHATVPDSIGNIAETLGLALVVLHRQIKFVEVTEQVHRSIVADQYDQVAFAWRVHELFNDLSMRRADPSDIVRAAAELLDVPVVLEDLFHQALALASAGHRDAELLRNWQNRSRRQAADEPRADDTGAWVTTPVGRGGDHWGRLIAVDPPADRTRTTMVLERAAQALVIHRMAERGRSDIEHRAQAGLIDDVAKHRIRSEADVAARAFALGLRPARDYIPAVMRVRTWIPEPDPVAAQRRNTRLLDVVIRATSASGHTGLFSTRGPGEVGMVLSPRGQAALATDTLAAALVRDAQREEGLTGIVLGIADTTGGLVDAIDRIEEAAHIAEVAADMPAGSKNCYRTSDIRLRGLLSSLRGDPRVQRFAESELRRLLLHDLENDDNLVAVLRGYLELAHHKSALAQRLHLSRPALYAKLARIQSILGVDLSDGESATSLHVALLILDAGKAPQLS